ncbi:hypothetical protein GQ457_13G001430 [Hibiscus cannabinus]
MGEKKRKLIGRISRSQISVKKWKDARVEKCLKAEILTGPSEFSYRELYAATRGFQSSRIIGCGAFGNVYKAVSVSLGAIGVVKRSKHSDKGKTEFLAELFIIAGLRHKNPVQLQGWCAEMGELLLEKTDVFSFGVVILEVACGRRPIEREVNSQKMVNLVGWVWGLHGEGRIIETADKRLNAAFREEEMRKLLLVGLSCAHPDSAERPSSRRVLQILNNEVDPIAVPKMKPSLFPSYSESRRQLRLAELNKHCSLIYTFIKQSLNSLNYN